MNEVHITIVRFEKIVIYPMEATMIDSNALEEKPWMIRAVSRV